MILFIEHGGKGQTILIENNEGVIDRAKDRWKGTECKEAEESFWGDGDVLYIDGGGGCYTIISLLQTYLAIHLK